MGQVLSLVELFQEGWCSRRGVYKKEPLLGFSFIQQREEACSTRRVKGRVLNPGPWGYRAGRIDHYCATRPGRAGRGRGYK